MRPSVYLLQTYLFQPKIKYFLKNFNIFFAFMLCNFLVRMLNFSFNLMFFCPVEKTTPKSCIVMAVGSFIFSAAPTAQNSPELHFRFMNYFIQPSLLESLLPTKLKSQIVEKSYLINTQRHAKKIMKWYFRLKRSR